jgi:capsular polysaccharide biosynthesis protein
MNDKLDTRKSLLVNDEIYLDDAFLFLKKTWKEILAFSFIGVFIAASYLLLSANKFQANAIIIMAYTLGSNESNKFTTVEEPKDLINRMDKIINSDIVINSCGINQPLNHVMDVSSAVKIKPYSKISSAVEIKVSRPTKELAKECLVSIYKLIADSQQEIGLKITKKTLKDIAIIDARLNQNNNLSKMISLDSSSSIKTYFDIIQDSRNYEDKKNILLGVNLNTIQAELMAPIFITDSKSGKNIFMNLVVGLVGGLLFGFFIALIQKMRKKIYG